MTAQRDTRQPTNYGALIHSLAKERKEAVTIADLAIVDEPTAEALWQRFAPRLCMLLNFFIVWDRTQAARFARSMDHEGLLRRIVKDLKRGQRKEALERMKRVTLYVAKTFDPSIASEAEMAWTVCRLEWLRDFSDVIGHAFSPDSMVNPRPFNVLVHERVWSLIEKPESRDPSTFDVDSYRPLLEEVIDHEGLGTSTPLTSSWAREAMLGGVLDAEGERPGLAALLWTLEVGIFDALWPSLISARTAEDAASGNRGTIDNLRALRMPSKPVTRN